MAPWVLRAQTTPPEDQPSPEVTEPEADAAEEPTDGSPDGDFDQSLEVTGQRLRGQVEGSVQPEIQLDETQIRSYGASSVGELVDSLAPLTRSVRGRAGSPGGPIVLLNGRRIASFDEISGLPPEAIERIDILPEEVALSYGYRADQRVMNIVLKENFRTVATAGGYAFSTRGGQASIEANESILRIGGAGRWNVDIRYQAADLLLESERDLVQSAPALPFDLSGNIGASPYQAGAEVDPSLSAAASVLVSIAAVPISAAFGAPEIEDFVPGANRSNVTDLGTFRSLLPKSESLALNGTLNHTLFERVAATVNLRFVANSSESRLGLPSLALTLPGDNPFSPFAGDVTLFRFADVSGPLQRETQGHTLHGGLTFGGTLFDWRWTLAANYDRVRNVTGTDTNADPRPVQAPIDANDPTFNPFAQIPTGFLPRLRDRSDSIEETVDAKLVVNGSPFRLPAGPVQASLILGVDTRGQVFETRRGGVTQSGEFSRGRRAVLGSLDLPVTNRTGGGLGVIGNLFLNANFEFEDLSDFGVLRTFGYGIRWAPFAVVDLAWTVTEEQGSPSVQQLGDPAVATPNARVFDFARGETVDIIRIDGGNPALRANSRRVSTVRVNVLPLGRGGPGQSSLSISANYSWSRTANPTSPFPVATAEVEAAFPERFVRDPQGRLVQLDSRLINFARSAREEMRWGVTFLAPLREPTTSSGPSSSSVPGGPPGASDEMAGPPVSGGPQRTATPTPRPRSPSTQAENAMTPSSGGQGSLNVSIFHTWRLTDEVLIRPGLPILDYLSGSAFSPNGGRSRNELELQANVFRNGFGASLRANWQEGTRVRGGIASPAVGGDLLFADFTTVSLSLFADLGQPRPVERFGFLRGTQLQLGINNLLDSHREVRDEEGMTPIGYQSGYLDPMGRSVRITLRKLLP